MALTYTVTRKSGPHYLGAVKAIEVEVDITEYAAGGASLTPALCSLGSITSVIVMDSVSDEGFAFRYNLATGKIMAYGHGANTGVSPLAEEDGTPDVGACRVLVLGN